MKIIRHVRDLPPEARGAAIAVGNFDGMHRGHRAVIGEAGHLAKTAGVPWSVLTFEPHPRALFRPDSPPFRLTPFRAKAREVAAMGVDYMIVLRFDRGFSQMPAEAFIHDVLVAGLGAHHVVCGYDFKFGHGRRGDSELLLHMGRAEGIGFTCVPQITDESGQGFSSTRIRDCLTAGDVACAGHVLGRTFEIEGRVVVGDKRGRTLGYPTANVALGAHHRPASGVYAVRVGVPAGGGDRLEWLDGVANLGRRPTFAGETESLEVHLFDFSGDLYGKRLRVALVGHLRAERKFDGIDELKAQIDEDSARARKCLAGTQRNAL